MPLERVVQVAKVKLNANSAIESVIPPERLVADGYDPGVFSVHCVLLLGPAIGRYVGRSDGSSSAFLVGASKQLQMRSGMNAPKPAMLSIVSIIIELKWSIMLVPFDAGG